MLKIEQAKDSEIDISQEILDELMRNLEDLEASTDLEGSAVVSKTGLRIASSETADVVWDIYSASPATLISLGEKISQGLQQGELRDIVIRGTKGYTIILCYLQIVKKDINWAIISIRFEKLSEKWNLFYRKLKQRI